MSDIPLDKLTRLLWSMGKLSKTNKYRCSEASAAFCMCTFDNLRLQVPTIPRSSTPSFQRCIWDPQCFEKSPSCALLRGISNRWGSNYLSDSKPECSLRLFDSCCATICRSRFYYSSDCLRLQLRCWSLSSNNIHSNVSPGKSSDLHDKFHRQTHMSTICQSRHLI